MLSSESTTGGAERRARRESTLLALTGIPTGAGKERRVIEWVAAWVQERPGLSLGQDAAGNVLLGTPDGGAQGGRGSVVFTGHLDHPAFVVDSVDGAHAVAFFRGGVLEPYFDNGCVVAHTAQGEIRGTIEKHTPAPKAEQGVRAAPDKLFRRCEIAFESAGVEIGDLATWELPAASIVQGCLHAPACDDLAAVASALCAMDELYIAGEAHRACVLLTLAEEVGFVGAIAACQEGTIPKGSLLLALENSRSFADSPLGAGPIVRVGDRLTTFSPGLTGQVAKVAAKLAGETPRVPGKPAPAPNKNGFRWQRKLMAGGSCEAGVYCAYGHEATCICLPLGNYHNMGELDRVEAALQRGEKVADAPIMPERIAMDDYHHMVDLLVGCAQGLEVTEPMSGRMAKLYEERCFVLQDAKGSH